MKKFIYIAILVFAFCFAAFAQATEIAGDPVYRYGKTDFKTYTEKLLNLLILIEQDKDLKSKGLIVLRLNKKDNYSYKISLLNNINKSVKLFKFDKTRLCITIFEGEFEETTLWVVPQGAELPRTESKDYKLVEGSKLKQQINKIFPRKHYDCAEN